VERVPGTQLAIGNVVCAVDFSTHSPKTVRWAQDMANEFGARLTLAHVTSGVEIYGPGGHTVLTDMKRELVNGAREQMVRIQQEAGTTADVFIGSGDVPKVMRQAAAETKADLLVVGCRSADRRFGNTAYGIIREAQIPVLCV
jgi:nucleotide-binding universal stress UspA family protein